MQDSLCEAIQTHTEAKGGIDNNLFFHRSSQIQMFQVSVLVHKRMYLQKTSLSASYDM